MSIRAILSFLVLITMTDGVMAQCKLNEWQKLTADDAGMFDRFGASMAATDDKLVVCAPAGVLGSGTGIGTAYVFCRQGVGWSQCAALMQFDAAVGDLFGDTVAIDDDVIVVGATTDDSGKGSAYVYREAGQEWEIEAKLIASDGAENDNFGKSLGVSGNFIVVGATGNAEVAAGAGAAYVFRFERGLWSEEAKLLAPDGQFNDRFGRSVAIWGDTLLVGAQKDDDAGSESGSVYVFGLNEGAWEFEDKLVASDASSGHEFGISAAMHADVAIIGTFGDNSAYVFRFDGAQWIEEFKLTSCGSFSEKFGQDVAIVGDRAAVGGQEGACVYAFEDPDWEPIAELLSSDIAISDGYGESVAITGNSTVVGAPADDDVCPPGFPSCNSGSAYIFASAAAETNPPCGAIDARQPSEPDGSSADGFTDILFLASAWGEPMLPDEFATTASGSVVPPVVIGVTVKDIGTMVHLNQPIPPKAWTTITHAPSGLATRLGSLPADVSNDKLSNASDVLYLIDVLNGVIDPALPAYQTDTDRSGATNTTALVVRRIRTHGLATPLDARRESAFAGRCAGWTVEVALSY